jgi:hypothetical protein
LTAFCLEFVSKLEKETPPNIAHLTVFPVRVTIALPMPSKGAKTGYFT